MGSDVKKSFPIPHYQRGEGGTIRSLVIVLITASATGCATVPQGAGFKDVKAKVSERIGQRVEWDRGASQDKAVNKAVGKLLQSKLTVDEAVQIALLNNRRLQATYEDLGLAQANLVQAGLLSNPVFDAAFGFQLSGGSTELTFGIVQDFLSILYRPLRKRIAAAEFEAAKLRVAGAVINLAAQARSSFYSLQADQQRRQFLQQVIQATAASADAARRLHAAGNITDLDVMREQALYEESRLVLATIETRLIQDREQLNALLGLWGQDTQWTIASRLPAIPKTSLTLGDLEQRAIKASLSLAATRKEIAATAAILGFTHATAFIPFLSSGVEAKREDGEWDVGPSLNLPIPLFDQGQARLAAARSDLRRAQQTYWAQAVEIRAAVRAARETALSARSRALHVQNVLLPLYTRVVNSTQLQYNAMQFGIFQLLLAKQQQISTGLRYIDALSDYWSARSALSQTLSGSLASVQAVPMTETSGGAIPTISLPGM